MIYLSLGNDFKNYSPERIRFIFNQLFRPRLGRSASEFSWPTPSVLKKSLNIHPQLRFQEHNEALNKPDLICNGDDGEDCNTPKPDVQNLKQVVSIDANKI